MSWSYVRDTLDGCIVGIISEYCNIAPEHIRLWDFLEKDLHLSFRKEVTLIMELDVMLFGNKETPFRIWYYKQSDETTQNLQYYTVYDLIRAAWLCHPEMSLSPGFPKQYLTTGYDGE